MFDTISSSKSPFLIQLKSWYCYLFTGHHHTTSEIKYESVDFFIQCALVIPIDNIHIELWQFDLLFNSIAELYRLVAVRREGALD